MEPQPAQPQSQGMFSGRLNRIGYLLSILYLLLSYVVPLTVLLVIIGIARGSSGIDSDVIAVILGLFLLLVIPVSIGVGIRRWHDLNKPGWYVILGFIPFISFLSAIFLFFVSGTQGSNSYGPPDTAPSKPKKVLFGKQA